MDLVCAIKYHDKSKQFYDIKNFVNKEEANLSNYIITHQGPCGACSNLPDLAVYLSKDLTSPVRLCGLIYSTFSKKWTIDCLMNLGFTEHCAQIWYYNIINTKKDCFWSCMYS